MPARLRQAAWSRRLGASAGAAGRRVSRWLLDLVLPIPASVEQERLGDVQKLLVVRPNFRIGNTLMAGPLVLALEKRFPGAAIDYLGGDTTTGLLAHLPIRRAYAVSRSHVLRPWRFVALFRRLRRERYDVAVEGGLGSFSGGLYAYLTGARHRLGCAGKADRFLDVRLAPIPYGHAYDGPVELAHRLGVECADRPVYTVPETGSTRASEVLEKLGLARDGEGRPFVGLFVGGHDHKRWPLDAWIALAGELTAAGVPLAVLVGPEERASLEHLRAAMPAPARLVEPLPLEVFAGLLAAATLVVTTDSGPMHLAVALGTPTVAVLRSERSRVYAPRGALDRVLVEPSVPELARVVCEHPALAMATPGSLGLGL